MSEAAAAEAAPPAKSGKKGLLIALLATLVLGGAGFAATFLGFFSLPFPTGHDTQTVSHGAEPMPDVSFVPVDELTISLGPKSAARYLRFSAQLEVAPAHVDEVRTLMPRIVDVLNGYLRAVEVSQLADPATLPRLKAQMLRRVQIVTGAGRVQDLLIAQFIMN